MLNVRAKTIAVVNGAKSSRRFRRAANRAAADGLIVARQRAKGDSRDTTLVDRILAANWLAALVGNEIVCEYLPVPDDEEGALHVYRCHLVQGDDAVVHVSGSSAEAAGQLAEALGRLGAKLVSLAEMVRSGAGADTA
jgi:hypothetical protein